MLESPNPAIDDICREQRRFLLDVAYRMVSSVSDAEDIVQEAFTRLLRVDLTEIDDVRAWLVVVVSRLCVDHFRAAHTAHEHTTGAWLPEPLVAASSAAVDPAEQVTLDDSVRMALLVVLEQLTPAERAAFVLHDVFQFSFETVSGIVGRSPAACRQLASRARRHIEANVEPTRFAVEPELHRRAVERFVAAYATGDMDALLAVLDEHVDGIADIGPTRTVFRSNAASGADEVATRAMVIFGPRSRISLEVRMVNGEPGVVATRGGELFGVIAFSVRDGKITELHAVADPAKLRHVPG